MHYIFLIIMSLKDVWLPTKCIIYAYKSKENRLSEEWREIAYNDGPLIIISFINLPKFVEVSI